MIIIILVACTLFLSKIDSVQEEVTNIFTNIENFTFIMLTKFIPFTVSNWVTVFFLNWKISKNES